MFATGDICGILVTLLSTLVGLHSLFFTFSSLPLWWNFIRFFFSLCHYFGGCHSSQSLAQAIIHSLSLFFFKQKKKMRTFFAATFVLLALTGSGLGLSVSNDATCGGNTGNTCLGSVFGNCCSQYGYCGSTTDHCSGGCQAGFGSCSSGGGGGGSQPAPVLKASSDGTCGGSTGSTCAGTPFGTCCSQYGYCGSTDAHCTGGCQSGFGSCSSGGGGSQPPPPALKTSPDGTCGGNTGSTCAGSVFGNCCSSSGWCGNVSKDDLAFFFFFFFLAQGDGKLTQM